MISVPQMIRCVRCMAYINPGSIFTHGGQRYTCNICSHSNDVPSEYFSHLDHTGRRMDIHQRPELMFAVADYSATKEFITKTPVSCHTLFVVDVTMASIQSGLLQTFSSTLKDLIGLIEGSVGIITFNSTVHFYDLSESLENPKMMIVGDLDEVFVPLDRGLFVSTSSEKKALEKLLDQFQNPTMFQDNSQSSCLGAAIQSAAQALKATGGRMVLVQTTFPNLNPGLLSPKDEKLLNSDTEYSLYSPNPFYHKLAETCVGDSIGIDVFLFPNGYTDIASIGVLASQTGGSTFMFPKFNLLKATEFSETLTKLLTSEFVYDVIGKIRVGTGLSVSNYYGCFKVQPGENIQIGYVDTSKAFAVELANDGSFVEEAPVWSQAAFLFTTPDGQRRIRVISFKVTATKSVAKIFSSSEMDTTMNLLSKILVSKMGNTSLKNIRDMVSQKCADILVSYKKNCANTASPGQLILPEAFKLFPVYCLGFLKSPILRNTDISVDARINSMREMTCMNVSRSIRFFYYTLFNILEVLETKELNETNILDFMVSLSWDCINPSGIFLLDNFKNLILWIGRECDPQTVKSLFGTTIEYIDVNNGLPHLETQESSRLWELLSMIEERTISYQPLMIIRQGEPLEALFKNQLMEDKIGDQNSYMEYLCLVHRRVQQEFSD